jgi:hypothetical protein
VFVALVIQHTNCMYLVIICGMFCSIIFSTLSDTRHAFRKWIIEYKIYALMFSIIPVWIIFPFNVILYSILILYYMFEKLPNLKKFSEILSQIYIGLRVMYPLFVSDFVAKLTYTDKYWKNFQMLNFVEIPVLEAILFLADRWSEWHEEANCDF